MPIRTSARPDSGVQQTGINVLSAESQTGPTTTREAGAVGDVEESTGVKPSIVQLTCCSRLFANVAEAIDHCNTVPEPIADARISTINFGYDSSFVPEVSTALTRAWRPLAVRQLPPVSAATLATIPPLDRCETFTLDFLSTTLKGEQWSPGFYWMPPSRRTFPPYRGYYVVDRDFEPYLPLQPGTHGAKLTPLIREDSVGEPPEKDIYRDVPLFISKATPHTENNQAREYIYHGTYSQTRYSDRLDHDRMHTAIPRSIKHHWAALLSSPTRPAWMTEALMTHFWPKPVYTEPLTAPSPDHFFWVHEDIVKTERAIDRALRQHAADLQDWAREARLRVSFVKKRDIMSAFEAADAALEPGLRLWWEYLCCTGFDREFYDALVRRRDEKRVEPRREPVEGAPTGWSPVPSDAQEDMLEAGAWAPVVEANRGRPAGLSLSGSGDSGSDSGGFRLHSEPSSAQAGRGWGSEESSEQ